MERDNLIRGLIKKYLLEGLLDEKYYSTTTTSMADPVAYSYAGKEKQDVDVEESPQQRANRFGLTYSSLINNIKDKDLVIIQGLFRQFKKTGKLDLKYSKDWHKDNFYQYLIELIAKEAKEGNDRARLLIEKIFDPILSKEVRASLIHSYNKEGDADSEDVMKVANNISKYRNALNAIDKYKGDDYFLRFILNRLQLSFSSQYPRIVANSKKGPKKQATKQSSYGNTYTISDIQKYLYAGNTAEEKNDKFIKFNQANKEIIDSLKASKANPIYIAIVDGMVNSKLDQEEMIEVYPQFFFSKRRR